MTSIDGIMLRGFRQADDTALPFVSMFYGSPSEYLWEDNEGTVHRIPQGEGGEQGDALMPLLFALGQDEALHAVSRQLRPDERFFAFQDDVYLTSKPHRVGACYTILEEELRVHACIRVHLGKTKVWNQAGLRPPVCVTCWRDWQGLKIQQPQCARVQDSQRRTKGSTFWGRPLVQDVQSAWLLLLHCACARATTC